MPILWEQLLCLMWDHLSPAWPMNSSGAWQVPGCRNMCPGFGSNSQLQEELLPGWSFWLTFCKIGRTRWVFGSCCFFWKLMVLLLQSQVYIYQKSIMNNIFVRKTKNEIYLPLPTKCECKMPLCKISEKKAIIIYPLSGPVVSLKSRNMCLWNMPLLAP